MKSRPAKHLYVCLALSLALISSGGSVHADDQNANAWPTPRALGRDIPTQRGGPSPEPSVNKSVASPASDQVLTLLQALEWALMNSPDLAAASQGVLAAEGSTRQAHAWTNPELEVEAAEFGGTGTRQGYDGAETSVRLTQPIELGGKRVTRRRVAQAEARLAGWDYEATRLDVLTQTKKAFVEVLLAQGQVALAESLLALAGDIQRAAAERVKAGKVPLLEETKAGVEVANARIVRDRAVRELDKARKHLAASWGETSPAFKEAGGDLETFRELPTAESLTALLDEAPEVARWKEEVAKARENVALEKAARIPDVNVSAGISRFEEDGSYAGTASLAFPLPLFDRNAGGLDAATRQVMRVEYEQRAARLAIMTELTEAHSQLESTRAEAQAIKADLLPGAEQALAAAQIGYREGKHGHLEVLDAQRTVSEAKAHYLDVLADYQKAVADVERLTGTPFETIQ